MKVVESQVSLYRKDNVFALKYLFNDKVYFADLNSFRPDFRDFLTSTRAHKATLFFVKESNLFGKEYDRLYKIYLHQSSRSFILI
jgi:hypothetical protein